MGNYKKKCLLSLLGLAFTSASMAATPVSGWYAAAIAGVGYLPNNVSIVGLSGADYDIAYNAGGAIGYKSGPIRYEGEVIYMRADANAFNLAGVAQTGVGGDSEATAAMANIYYDFDNMSESFSPFIGVGIGYAHVSTSLTATGPVFVTAFKGSDNVFAYQGTLGMTYNFAENSAITLAYSYLGTDKAKNIGKSFQAHLGSVSLLYRFNKV